MTHSAYSLTTRESMFDRCDPWCDASDWLDRLREPCFVYFVQSGTAVKIGKAINPYTRLDELQCGNPVGLRLLCLLPGDYELEHRFHRWLREDRVRGEWFDGPLVDEALEFASVLRAKLVEAYDGGDTAPEWRGLATWPRASLAARKARHNRVAPVTVRYVEPDPVPLTEEMLLARERSERATRILERQAFQRAGLNPPT